MTRSLQCLPACITCYCPITYEGIFDDPSFRGRDASQNVYQVRTPLGSNRSIPPGDQSLLPPPVSDLDVFTEELLRGSCLHDAHEIRGNGEARIKPMQVGK